ncbi:calcitonin gene-related peptide type 1 receptor isoform X2 [Onthophagus taurus]|uniref:calcitonin gene-related peptide type 1 receptor isoform X2 n=1 Tax=Onthophagus taurus TaxID=166361 RepID=UPI000C205951|nr:calcitonin gene-related peptide type 1 receptor isoform X2 [Onthophagus taurus]
MNTSVCDDIFNASPTNISELFCPRVFDDWLCWPDTPAGKYAKQLCPNKTGFDTTRFAYRLCEDDGTWFFNPMSNKTWSNYTTCVDLESLEFNQMVNNIYKIGYFISLVALIISLGILTYFKSLRCARITVHMNLFASFAVNAFLWILWYNLVVDNPTVLNENVLWCRFLHIILTYFLISTYSWMLCEGVYLHTVLVSAFISEVRLLRCILLLGWGLPMVTVTLYASLRTFNGTEEETAGCWMDDTKYNIVQVVLASGIIILNILFLCNILRVLCTKLRRAPHAGSGASRASLQALRATLLLVPLLGLNYLLTPFRPENNSVWERVYAVMSAVTVSPQGLCVAILYCFCNGEVIAQIKRKWSAWAVRTRANSCTVTTVSFVRSSYPNVGEEKV